MKAITRLIVTSAGFLIPQEPNVIKIANALVKLGMTKHGSFGESNPYSDLQRSTGHFSSQIKLKKATNTLENEGWKKEEREVFLDKHTKGKDGHSFTSPQGTRLIIDKRGYIEIFGKKKAKNLTVPYYD
jgi:hypothetical protein